MAKKKPPVEISLEDIKKNLKDLAKDGSDVAKHSANKTLLGILKEEQPDIDLVIDCYFVPIVFDDKAFVASLAKAEKI